MQDVLQQIVGEKLSAITFVLDYHQFHFDGPAFNVFTPVTVISADQARSGDELFRNLVCGQIGKVVRAAAVCQGRDVTLTFGDDSQVKFSLKESEYTGPEAVNFRSREGQLVVF